jgi:hypothetical protein
MKTTMKRMAMWVYCTLAAMITFADGGGAQ